MMIDDVPFADLLSNVVDNREKTCPTATTGLPLIATNCVKNTTLYPVFEKIRYVSPDTYKNWFRGHPMPDDLIFVVKGSPEQVCLAPNPVGLCIAQDMRLPSGQTTERFIRLIFLQLSGRLWFSMTLGTCMLEH